MSCHQIDDPKQFCAFCIHNYFMVSFIISGKFDTLNLTRLQCQYAYLILNINTKPISETNDHSRPLANFLIFSVL